MSCIVTNMSIISREKVKPLQYRGNVLRVFLSIATILILTSKGQTTVFKENCFLTAHFVSHLNTLLSYCDCVSSSMFCFFIPCK